MSYINAAYELGQRAAVEDFYREKNASIAGEVAEKAPGLIERVGRRLAFDAALGIKAIPDAASVARYGREMFQDIRRAPKAFEEARKGIDPVMEQIRAAKELKAQQQAAHVAYGKSIGTPMEDELRNVHRELSDRWHPLDTKAKTAIRERHAILQDAENKVTAAKNMKRQVGLIGASLAGTAAGGAGGYYTADKAGLGTGGKVLGTLAGAGLGTLAGGHLRASRLGIPRFETPVSDAFIQTARKAAMGH